MGENASFAGCVHFNPSSWHHLHHAHVVYVFSCYFKVCFVLSQSLAWDKQEAKFGDVMSVQKHSLHTQDLACLCSILHLKNYYFIILLIFSFIFDFVGKVVQMKAYLRLEERDFTTLLQRRDASMSRHLNVSTFLCNSQRRNVVMS